MIDGDDLYFFIKFVFVQVFLILKNFNFIINVFLSFLFCCPAVRHGDARALVARKRAQNLAVSEPHAAPRLHERGRFGMCVCLCFCMCVGVSVWVEGHSTVSLVHSFSLPSMIRTVIVPFI